MGVSGTPQANEVAAAADVVIGVGTRYSDFTSISKSAFQNPDVQFININVSEFDAFKQGAIALTGDAKVILEELNILLKDFKVNDDYASKIAKHQADWDAFVTDIYTDKNQQPVFQGAVIGAVNEIAGPKRHGALCCRIPSGRFT